MDLLVNGFGARPRLLAALLLFALAGCQSLNPSHVFGSGYMHGKVALCSSAASIGPAVVVVTNTDTDHPGVKTVPEGTPAAGVCAAINAAAIEAGFKTVYDPDHDVGVQILAKDADSVQIDAKNVRVVVQQF